MPRIVENSGISYYLHTCMHKNNGKKTKLFTGIISKVLLLLMERLGLVVYGVNLIVSPRGRK
jgi:hypothetical protein